MLEFCWLQTFGSKWWQAAGSCKYGIETTGSVNMGVRLLAKLDWLRNCLLLKTCFAPCSCISSLYLCFIQFYLSVQRITVLSTLPSNLEILLRIYTYFSYYYLKRFFRNILEFHFNMFRSCLLASALFVYKPI